MNCIKVQNLPQSERVLTYSMVSYCVNEGKSMDVRNSITPQGEKLTNMQLKNQWNNIDWKKAENHVNRLQVRITKAVKKGKWYLVKRLEYLLTHSYYAKLLATRKGNNLNGLIQRGLQRILFT